MRSTDVSSIISRGKTEHQDAGAGQWINVVWELVVLIRLPLTESESKFIS